MIATSEKWRAAQLEPVVPEAFIEIAYEVTEPGLQESAVESNNGAAYYSQHAEIVENENRAHKLYATLEHNLWGLGGEHDILPDAAPYGHTGYVSDVFVGSASPVVSVSLDSVRTQPIPGITITWSSKYNEYPTRFQVSAYNGNTLLASREFNNRSTKTACEMPLSDYTEIRITILEWCLPNHRARIEKVFLGVENRYSKSDIVSYTHSQYGDLLSAELPKNSISFSLDNSSGMWNPDNLVGNVRYLSEQQMLTVRYGLKLDDEIEWVDAGTFWISEWETSSNGLEVRFTARDAIEFMSDEYTGRKTGTLYDIAVAALEQAELPTLTNGNPRYQVSNDLREWEIDFSENTTVYTIAEVVQLCANAACCVMFQDRKGVLRVEPLRESTSGYKIGKYVSYSHPEFALTKPLKSVVVNDGLGSATNSAIGEVQTIENTLITTELMARRVAEWVRKALEGRRTLSGDYRADPTLDVFDKIAVESKYGANNAIYITEVEYSFSGAFKGRYAGRITDFESEKWYSGELISGEV